MKPASTFVDARQSRIYRPPRRGDDRSEASSKLESMIPVIALTQFAFFSLGIALLKILIHGSYAAPASIQLLDSWSFRFFLIPVIWTVYATITVRADKPRLSAAVAQTIGIVLAVASFLFLAAVVFYLPARL